MTPRDGTTVAVLEAADCTDGGLIDQLCTLINDAYAVAEDGLWLRGVPRTSTGELRALVTAGALLVAALPHAGLVGCVCVRDVTPDTHEFGMLVTAPDQRGRGVGRALLDEVERRGRARGLRAVQLELLAPTEFVHPGKEHLRAWYRRRGYRHMTTSSMTEAHPHLRPLLATPCEMQVYSKQLKPFDTTAKAT